MDGHGLDAHLATCTQYAQCDFTAVRYNNFFEHVSVTRLIVLPLVDDYQRLSEFDWLTVLNANRLDHARYFGLDLIHHFHCFNDA